MQYGTSNTVASATALNEDIPTPPAYLRDFAIYIGRVVIQEGAAVFTFVTNPFITSEDGTVVTDHGDLAGLTDDDHTQYALLAGRSGGQSLIGGTGSGDDLTLESTSDGTKGNIIASDNIQANDGITIVGATTGSSTFDAPANGDTITYTLPSNDGDADQCLTTNGSGTLSWENNQIASAGDIKETSFAAANNQSTPANVTGLAFANGTVRSFEALVSTYIDATADLFEVFTLRGIQRGADWQMSITSTGDESGIEFTINSSGQVLYTSTNVAGWSSNTIKFRAITTSV